MIFFSKYANKNVTMKKIIKLTIPLLEKFSLSRIPSSKYASYEYVPKNESSAMLVFSFENNMNNDSPNSNEHVEYKKNEYDFIKNTYEMINMVKNKNAAILLLGFFLGKKAKTMPTGKLKAWRPN